MKKNIILFLSLLLFVSAYSQHRRRGISGDRFRYGAMLGAGLTPTSKVNPLDSLGLAATVGVVGEINLGDVYIRSGLSYQSPKSAMVPFLVYLATSDHGGFMGAGLNYDITETKPLLYTVFLGNRITANIDLGLFYEGSFNGHDPRNASFFFKIMIFPMRQCHGACSWLRDV